MALNGKITCSLNDIKTITIGRINNVVLSPNTRAALDHCGVELQDLVLRTKQSMREPQMMEEALDLKYNTYITTRDELFRKVDIERTNIIEEEKRLAKERPLNHAERLLMLEVERSEMIATRQQKAMEQTIRQNILMLKKEEDAQQYNEQKLKEKSQQEEMRIIRNEAKSRSEKVSRLLRKSRIDTDENIQKEDQKKEFSKIRRDLLAAEEDRERELMIKRLHKEQLEATDERKKEEIRRKFVQQSKYFAKRKKDRILHEKKERDKINFWRTLRTSEILGKSKDQLKRREMIYQNSKEIERQRKNEILEKLYKKELRLAENLEKKQKSSQQKLERSIQQDEYRASVYEQAIKNENEKKKEALIKIIEEQKNAEIVLQQNEIARELKNQEKAVIDEKKRKNVERLARAKQALALERERRFLEDQRRAEQANRERRNIVLDRTQSAIQMSLTSHRAKEALFELSKTGNWKKAPKTLNKIFSQTISGRSASSKNSFLDVTDQLSDVLTPRQSGTKKTN